MFRPAAAITLLALAACNGAPSESADAEATTSSTYALIAVQRSSNASGTGARSELVARFVRSRAEASTTFAALGSTLGMPQLGTCAKVSTLLSTRDDAAGPIELLDVGRVESGTFGSPRVALEPRELPNLGDFARGTFYSLPNARVADVAPGVRYDVNVGGSNDFAPIAISGAAPHEPADIAIDGVLAGSSIKLNTEQSVQLRWTPDAASDIIYVDVSDALSHESTRCAFADTGSASVPVAATSGQLEVHRLRRHAATATTELRFDFYRSFTFQRQ